MGTLSVPTEHGLTTFWVFLRAALSAHALRMASGLLLGVLVGGPGLFPTYPASARATCTPRHAFVSSNLDLVKGYKLPPAAPEEKVTFTIWPETWHVPEDEHRASGCDVRLSSFVDGAELFSVKNAEMAIPGTLQAAIAQDFMQLGKAHVRPKTNSHETRSLRGPKGMVAAVVA